MSKNVYRVYGFTYFQGCNSFQEVLRTFQSAKANLGEILSAFEFLDTHSMTCVTRNLTLANPVSDCPFYLLIETSGSNGGHDEEKLNYFLENSMQNNIVVDGTIATEPSKINVKQCNRSYA